MQRRRFLGRSVAGGMVWAAGAQAGEGPHRDLPRDISPAAYASERSGYSPFTTPDYYAFADDLTIERRAPGRPHAGKVLAAIQPHADDVPLYCGGTVAKLIDEGYTGYVIRISNDEAGGSSPGEAAVRNEAENQAVAAALGCRKAFSFYYRNHRMDDCSAIEIRARLIFLFRLLQVNTVVALDPYNQYEENPDHRVTARAVEAACWMAGSNDYPEHFKAGLKPAQVREKYYHARSPEGHNLVNRIVDISAYVDRKARANVANRSQGPAGDSGARLRRELAAHGRRLPLLGDNDDAANVEYVKHFLLEDFRTLGKRFGVQCAEAFRYIGPPPDYARNIRRYADENSIPL